MAGITITDGDGASVSFEATDAQALLALVDDFDAATISACPDCRSRVLAATAVADVLDAAAPHPRSGAVIELADDAPTSHLYLVDRAECRHARWRDPGAQEWRDTIVPPSPPRPKR
jgi:hypothetical protein